MDSRAPTTHRISVAHTCEAAHRLPHMNGKCTSLHGHSWRVTIAISAPQLRDDGTVVEFGAVKARLRAWIDTHLDHATMLGFADPLVQPLSAAGCKVLRFGVEEPTTHAERLATDLPWPTVEAVAVLLWRVSRDVLTDLPCPAGTRPGKVTVRETHLNTAEYDPTDRS